MQSEEYNKKCVNLLNEWKQYTINSCKPKALKLGVFNYGKYIQKNEKLKGNIQNELSKFIYLNRKNSLLLSLVFKKFNF